MVTDNFIFWKHENFKSPNCVYTNVARQPCIVAIFQIHTCPQEENNYINVKNIMPYVSENVGEIIYAYMADDTDSYIRYSHNDGDFLCNIILKKIGFEYSYIYLHFI